MTPAGSDGSAPLDSGQPIAQHRETAEDSGEFSVFDPLERLLELLADIAIEIAFEALSDDDG